jgi:hypothetical protein
MTAMDEPWKTDMRWSRPARPSAYSSCRTPTGPATGKSGGRDQHPLRKVPHPGCGPGATPGRMAGVVRCEATYGYFIQAEKIPVTGALVLGRPQLQTRNSPLRR